MQLTRLAADMIQNRILEFAQSQIMARMDSSKGTKPWVLPIPIFILYTLPLISSMLMLEVGTSLLNKRPTKQLKPKWYQGNDD